MTEVNNEKLHIRLHVYDEEIEVTIKRSDEEFYRKAAKLITDRYNAYSQAYKGNSAENAAVFLGQQRYHRAFPGIGRPGDKIGIVKSHMILPGAWIDDVILPCCIIEHNKKTSLVPVDKRGFLDGGEWRTRTVDLPRVRRTL